LIHTHIWVELQNTEDIFTADFWAASCRHVAMSPCRVWRQLGPKWAEWRKRPALLHDYLKNLLKENPLLVPSLLNMAAEKGIQVQLLFLSFGTGLVFAVHPLTHFVMFIQSKEHLD